MSDGEVTVTTAGRYVDVTFGNGAHSQYSFSPEQLLWLLGNKERLLKAVGEVKADRKELTLRRIKLLEEEITTLRAFLE